MEMITYHKSQAGNPALHDDQSGEWFFQPKGYAEGDIFSPGYSTEQAAREAADKWESEESDEVAAQ